MGSGAIGFSTVWITPTRWVAKAFVLCRNLSAMTRPASTSGCVATACTTVATVPMRRTAVRFGLSFSLHPPLRSSLMPRLCVGIAWRVRVIDWFPSVATKIKVVFLS